MRLVVALGGNALVRRGEAVGIAVQRRRLRAGMRSLAGVFRQNEVVLTHGNGPQVGQLALRCEYSREAEAVPLDVLVAESQGQIGYLIEQEVRRAAPGKEVATLLTTVVVAGDDPAFDRPTKPIGPVFPREAGERLAPLRGWTMAPDGDGLRRVVPSPFPRRVLGMAAVRALLDAGAVVVCGGGGGIPVLDVGRAGLTGVEAVVDKDHTAALIAEAVGADGLVLLTDVAGVSDGHGGDSPRLIREAGVPFLRSHAFDEGTMGPKVAAACSFAERTGGWAAIGALEEAAAVVDGAAGTRVHALVPEPA